MGSRQRSLRALCAYLLVLCASGAARGAGAERNGTGEFFFIAQYALSDEQTTIFRSDGESATVEYDDGFKLGPGFGYNVSDHLNLNLSVLFGSAEIEEDEGSGFGSSSDDNTLIMPELNVDWNVLGDALTPFVTGGGGVMYFPGDFGGTAELTYGAGAGVRWDFSDQGFLKLWYRARWFDLDDADDAMLLHTFNVSVGIMR